MKSIIKNGSIVSPAETYEADILIENGKISSIGTNMNSENAEIIDAKGKYVIPGAVDVHTHFDLQSGKIRAVDNFYTGTIAAACGGTTTIIDHMAFGPKGCTLRHQIDAYHNLADNKAVIDYSFHGVLQHIDKDTLNEMEILVKEGISSFKLYLTYDFKLNDSEVLRVLERMQKIGGVTAIHAENDDVINYLRDYYVENNMIKSVYHAKSRPDYCEAEAVGRIIKLAAMANNAPLYIVHLSCRKSLIEVKNSRESGAKNIYVETCPQYLLLTDEKYLDENYEGLKYIMSPPLRKKEDCIALWDGLAKGDIQVIATDHCPFNFKIEKQLGKDDFTKCPSGVPGVEERVRLIFSEGVMKNRISINKFVEVMCSNPAKIYGIYPQKGAIMPGSDADIVIIDPNKEEIIKKCNLHSAVDYSAYEGVNVKGAIDLVIQRGKIIVKNNNFRGKKGDGKFLRRKTLQ